MTKATIKKAVCLFISCQSLISEPKRLYYKDLLPFLMPHMSEEEFNSLVKDCSSDKKLFRPIEHSHPRAMLIEIKIHAEKLKTLLSHNEKLTFLTILLKLIKHNKQELNQSLNTAFYRIAEIFSYNYEQTTSIRKLLSQKEPTHSDYHDSVLLTNIAPDYAKVIDGLKVIYNPAFDFSIWVKNVKSVNNMLVSVISIGSSVKGYSIKAGDVLTYTSEVQDLLASYGVTLNTISARILSNVNAEQRVEIASTERSPRVVINPAENRIEIEGISMVTEREDFFKPVFHWLEKIKVEPPSKFCLHINLASFNAYSSRMILKVIQRVTQLESPDCKTKIYWYHEEEDHEIKNAGEYYASMVNREFIYITTEKADYMTA